MRGWRIAVSVAAPVSGAVLLGVLLLLALGQPGLAGKILHVLASRYSQSETSFTDTYQLLGVMQCHRQGIDVYVANPCDLYGRPHVYSPAWLLGSLAPVTTGWTPVVGCTLAVLFVASLFLLPKARTGRQALVLTLGVLSNAVIFGVHQGNADVLVFVLCAVAGRLLLRSLPLRFAGYALFLLVALLKFYPISLMALVARERIRVLAVLFLVSVLSVAAFVLLCGRDASRALGMVPTGKITQMFGAKVLAQGLSIFPYGIRGSNEAVTVSLPAAVAVALLLAGVLAFSFQLWRSDAMREAAAALTEEESVFLGIGCVLLLGCFFMGESYRYRGVFFLFALPGLTALWREARAQAARVVFGATTAAIVFLLWSVYAGNGMDSAMTALGVPDTAGSLVFAAFWLVRELLWWSVVGVLTAALGRLAWNTEAVRLILSRTARPASSHHNAKRGRDMGKV